MLETTNHIRLELLPTHSNKIESAIVIDNPQMYLDIILIQFIIKFF
jgi:hypothetical protein